MKASSNNITILFCFLVGKLAKPSLLIAMYYFPFSIRVKHVQITKINVRFRVYFPNHFLCFEFKLEKQVFFDKIFLKW
jgi:hypothetical protein